MFPFLRHCENRNSRRFFIHSFYLEKVFPGASQNPRISAFDKNDADMRSE